MDMFFEEWDQGLVPKGRRGIKDVDEDSEFISNQGSFICVFSPEAFMAPEVYRAEMDRYIGTVGSMEPWPGQER